MDSIESQPREGFDLTKLRPVGALIRSRAFPYLFQTATLVFLTALIVMGWGSRAPASVSKLLFAKCNLVTLLIWGFWWPLIIFATVLFGRVWCAVCPLELINNLSERVGRRLGIGQRALGRWLASGACAVALYALVQLLMEVAQVERVPAYTAIFLLVLMAAAFLVGLFLKDRAFCRAFCPVGQLLATYGRGGMLAVRAGSAPTCGGCSDKACSKSCNRAKTDARSCPSLLVPSTLKSSRECLLCGQCLKACPKGNMRLFLRWPFHAGDMRELVTSWPITILVMLESGFVSLEFCEQWPSAGHIFEAVPYWLSHEIGIRSLRGFLTWSWAFVVVPLVVWTLIAGVLRWLGIRQSVGHIWRRLALPTAVVVSTGHLVMALTKLDLWAGFLPGALRDPNGAQTATTLMRSFWGGTPSLLPGAAVAVIGMILLLTGLLYAIREFRLANPSTNLAVGSNSRTPYASDALVTSERCSEPVRSW